MVIDKPQSYQIKTHVREHFSRCWKAAIMDFLTTVWEGNDAHAYIRFDFVCLRLDTVTKTYGLSLTTERAPLIPSGSRDLENVLIVSNARAEVNDALATFSKNKHIRHLVIQFDGNNCWLQLSKSRIPQELFFDFRIPPLT